MGFLRPLLREKFSKKTYPDPKNPIIAEKIAEGRALFARHYMGRTHPYPWIIAGKKLLGRAGTYKTYCPGDRNFVIGEFPLFEEKTLAHLDAGRLDEVLNSGLRFAETVPWHRRMDLLLEISKVVEKRFWILVAAKQYETGQNIAEAIGETDEEVDFPLSVAMYLEELNEDLLLESTNTAGDFNGHYYAPHGTFLNASPFNFPGAIPMDMACKALAMGNAFIEKSSDKSSLCGYLVYESIRIAFENLGIPHNGVINYAPGGADTVHMFLESPFIRGLSFTGSYSALKEIKDRHGKRDDRMGYAGKSSLVYGSEETSGVNVVAVWSDADVIHASKECVKSFVGRSGQKCSSARVIIVHEKIFDSFAACIEHELEKVKVGKAYDMDIDLGALITVQAGEKISADINNLCTMGIIEAPNSQRIAKISEGYPIILFAGRDMLRNEDKAKILMNTELFGPVATVVRARNIVEVRRLCKLSEFALTGSYFSSNIETCIALSKIIKAGNQYQNRKCTGAFVETESFGGLLSHSGPGVKRKAALSRFGSLQIRSGFYPRLWGNEERQKFISQLKKEGVVFSKE